MSNYNYNYLTTESKCIKFPMTTTIYIFIFILVSLLLVRLFIFSYVHRYTFEVAPVFTLMEEVTLRKLRECVGFTEGDGIFCPGGKFF